MLLAASVTACTPSRVGPPPSSDIDEDAFRDELSTLASDEFAGRRPGTAGEARTVAYIVDQFRRLKLKSLSGDSYVQNVPMLEFTPDGPPSLAVAGRGAARPVEFGTGMVIWSRLDQADVALQGSELVFAGYGIVAREYGRDDYAGVDVHGKTVVVLSGDPGPVPGPAPRARTHMPGFYARAEYKIDEAARHGAGGVLVIHDPKATQAPWDVIAGDATGVRLDRVGAGGGAGRAAVEGWLSADAGRLLFATAGVDYPAAVAAAAGGAFRAMPLGLQADAHIRQSVRRIASSNVIGVLPGTQHRDEYIVYTAHWDHFGVRSTVAGDVTYPGAVDNASGVAGLLQLARSFTRTNPAPGRSIVFMAVTGGEAHLAGSAWYVENPPFPLADTVAELDLDTLRIGGPTRDVTEFGFGQSELDGYLRSAAALQGRELHADPDDRMHVPWKVGVWWRYPGNRSYADRPSTRWSRLAPHNVVMTCTGTTASAYVRCKANGWAVMRPRRPA